MVKKILEMDNVHFSRTLKCCLQIDDEDSHNRVTSKKRIRPLDLTTGQQGVPGAVSIPEYQA